MNGEVIKFCGSKYLVVDEKYEDKKIQFLVGMAGKFKGIDVFNNLNEYEKFKPETKSDEEAIKALNKRAKQFIEEEIKFIETMKKFRKGS